MPIGRIQPRAMVAGARPAAVIDRTDPDDGTHRCRRKLWLGAGREHLDDVHASAAARTRCRQDARLIGRGFGRLRLGRGCHGQQLSRPGDALAAISRRRG